jgi:predicted HicB family RNase H-like nuclease
MKGLFKYKGFYGSSEISHEDNVLHGKIECIHDLVTYEAETVEALRHAFEEAVEDYLETCKMLGREPERPMSGTFNVRIGEELHKKVSLAAKGSGMSLNDYIKKTLAEKLEKKPELHMHFHWKHEQTSTFSSRSGRETSSRKNVLNFQRRAN